MVTEMNPSSTSGFGSGNGQTRAPRSDFDMDREEGTVRNGRILDFRLPTSVPCPWQAWRRPTFPSLRDLVPLAQENLTAEFGMGSGFRLPAMTTRPAKDG